MTSVPIRVSRERARARKIQLVSNPSFDQLNILVIEKKKPNVDSPEDHERGGGFVKVLEGPVVDGDRVHLQKGSGRLRHEPDQVRHHAVFHSPTLFGENTVSRVRLFFG